jgi:hypothetical protein
MAPQRILAHRREKQRIVTSTWSPIAMGNRWASPPRRLIHLSRCLEFYPLEQRSRVKWKNLAWFPLADGSRAFSDRSEP